jgi:hypothetical protein
LKQAIRVLHKNIADIALGYKKSRELSKVPLEKITIEEDADLTLNLFDFCTFGRTVEEILGTKFAKISFLNLYLELRQEMQFYKGL